MNRRPSKASPKNSEKIPVVREEPQKKKASFKEKQEYSKLQEEIEELERRKTKVIGLLNAGSTNHAELQQWSNEVEQITSLIEDKTARWLALSEIIE